MKSSLSIWHYVVSVKSTVKILSIFVAFLENTNFNIPKSKWRSEVPHSNFKNIHFAFLNSSEYWVDFCWLHYWYLDLLDFLKLFWETSDQPEL